MNDTPEFRKSLELLLALKLLSRWWLCLTFLCLRLRQQHHQKKMTRATRKIMMVSMINTVAAIFSLNFRPSRSTKVSKLLAE